MRHVDNGFTYVLPSFSEQLIPHGPEKQTHTLSLSSRRTPARKGDSEPNLSFPLLQTRFKDQTRQREPRIFQERVHRRSLSVYIKFMKVETLHAIVPAGHSSTYCPTSLRRCSRGMIFHPSAHPHMPREFTPGAPTPSLVPLSQQIPNSLDENIPLRETKNASLVL